VQALELQGLQSDQGGGEFFLWSLHVEKSLMIFVARVYCELSQEHDAEAVMAYISKCFYLIN
jgi:hypothetical protein